MINIKYNTPTLPPAGVDPPITQQSVVAGLIQILLRQFKKNFSGMTLKGEKS